MLSLITQPPQAVKLLFQFLFIANSQLVTAFCASAGQHFPAIGSLHPFTETVNGLTAAAMGLKCTFHFKSVFSLFTKWSRENGICFSLTYRSPHPLVL